ncbi:MAG: N-acetylneuraminate synthase family protein [Deltaproteobacteria bacterium]|nr:N-acetylneuraminate synthase family protein [Deltaproteobacteria bacterium]
MTRFAFDPLFVFDLANNHQGSLDHGLRIVSAIGEVVRGEGVRAALKVQLRHLESFIHPAARGSKENRHVERFLSTALSGEDFGRLIAAVRTAGLIPMATPFDEKSVDSLEELGVEVVKIGSCSATDWPLIRRVCASGRPVIASTGGMSLIDIDRLVATFTTHDVEFALMHCVSIYPTPDDALRLNQIDVLRARYPWITVGFSTHETPTNLTAVQLAYAKGARIFERHVGLPAAGIVLNAYSSTPEQVRDWIRAHEHARAMCGGTRRAPSPLGELESLRSLMRGVFASRPIARGQTIARDDVFFAMPLTAGQLSCSQWTEGLTADGDYEQLAPLSLKLAEREKTREQLVSEILLQVKGALSSARIAVNRDASFEISHHYGLQRFREFGAVIVTCVNRQYCKKLLVLLPRQKHPYHMHRTKEETFQLLAGDLELERDGTPITLRPGDTALVGPGVWHKFHTLGGAVIEEISTTDSPNDSVYEDWRINSLAPAERKTSVRGIETNLEQPELSE